MNAQATAHAQVEVEQNCNGVHFRSTKNVNQGGFHLGSCRPFDEKCPFHPRKDERFNGEVGKTIQTK